MKPKFNSPDELFRNALKHDTPELTPNEGIEKRLNYYYQLKQASRKPHQNSFVDLFSWLLSFKNIGLKTSMISVCLVYFLFLGNFQNNPHSPQISDSCQIAPCVVDSLSAAKDSCK